MELTDDADVVFFKICLKFVFGCFGFVANYFILTNFSKFLFFDKESQPRENVQTVGARLFSKKSIKLKIEIEIFFERV